MKNTAAGITLYMTALVTFTEIEQRILTFNKLQDDAFEGKDYLLNRTQPGTVRTSSYMSLS